MELAASVINQYKQVIKQYFKTVVGVAKTSFKQEI